MLSRVRTSKSAKAFLLTNSLSELKTVIIMEIEVRHTCSEVKEDYIIVRSLHKGGFVYLSGICNSTEIEYVLDVSTAIKLSKSIRTEINKAKKQ